MRLGAAIIFLSCHLAVVALAGTPEDVKATFDGYKSAILQRQGTTAVEYVTKATVSAYQKYVDCALTGDRKTLESLALANRLQVLLLRHRVPREELIKMDGRSCFVYAVDHGWIGENGVVRVGLGHVEESNGVATAEVTLSGERTPLRALFRKEGEQWRFDLMKFMRFADEGLAATVKKDGITENELIFRILETLSGRKVPQTIWEPVSP